MVHKKETPLFSFLSKSRVKRLIARYINKIIYSGENYHCPVCDTNLKRFLPSGIKKRENAKCPVCGSLERHRLIWLYLSNETGLFSGNTKKLLHIAPEKCFIEKLRQMGGIEYLTADLSRDCMVKMDITKIQYPNHSFDVIYCSHVLEHIRDDRKAMQELFRVLKPHGWAVLQVPLCSNLETTLEDKHIADPKERERLYGHPDHVRMYEESDYCYRLEEAGFSVEVVPYLKSFNFDGQRRYGIIGGEENIYLCRKNNKK